MRKWVVVLVVCLVGGVGGARELPVHMLVPGFTVRELPVKLTNINNVEYMADGKLLALGYDGRLHLLWDSDGDGLEDTSSVWWQNDKNPFRGPIGMLVAPEGVYVPAKGRLSLLKDTDNDGKADTEEIVATGWKEIFQSVDALGVAKDKDGNIYFGRGCANFADAYLLDKQGKAHYDINSEYGTILKVSPDRKKREIVATGVRFSVGIAINRFGDIFWTDQEGDTWTKGNHLDELNVLMPGRRHYGFPERHPVHLPNTLDEPPVVSFGPQHQSTCGLVFNEPRADRPRFGPAVWENDAIVAGESRGKLWRASVSKTKEGYVGFRPHAFARLDMLTIGQTISPQGDLVVCTHSGPPDWGTGPKGIGKIFKISYTNAAAPQPVAAWPNGEKQVAIAFDRPVDPSVLGRLSGITLEAGEFVRAADRMETLRPPYGVVKQQMATGWANVKVTGSSLSDDGRTLLLNVEKFPWRSWYAVGIPGILPPGGSGLGDTVDLDFEMTGLQAAWKSADEKENWQGWVPHLDPNVTRDLLAGSAPHQQYFKRLNAGGTLELKGTLDLPGRIVTLRLRSSGALSFVGPSLQAEVDQSSAGTEARLSIDVGSEKPLLGIVVRSEAGTPLTLTATYHTDLDPTERPIPVEGFLVPWTPKERQAVKTEMKKQSPLLAGADWNRGKELFFGEAKCGTCHTVNDQGGRVGPNLSNLVHLDPESVLTHIVEPNRTINPDHVNYIVKTKDGQQLSGLVYADGDNYRINPDAETMHVIPKAKIATIKPADVSIMPEGYKELGEQKLKDILMFLTGERPKVKKGG